MNTEALENLPKSQKIILIIGVCVILIGGYLYFFFLPMESQVSQLRESIYRLNRDIAVNEIKLKKLDKLKRENMLLKKKLDLLKAQLPEEEEVSELLKQISDLSRESGLEIILWKPRERKKDPSGMYIEIPVDVEVSGSYHALAIFFDKIRRLPRIVNISNLTMGGAKVVGDRIRIHSRFTATTFAIARNFSGKR